MLEIIIFHTEYQDIYNYNVMIFDFYIKFRFNDWTGLSIILNFKLKLSNEFKYINLNKTIKFKYN